MVDITERKQTQLLIEEKEQQLRLVTDSLPVLIAYVDSDLRYGFTNLAYEEWFGMKAEAYKGTPIHKSLGPGYEMVLPHVKLALKGETVHFREKLRHRELGMRDIETVQYLTPRTTARWRGSMSSELMSLSGCSNRRPCESNRTNWPTWRGCRPWASLPLPWPMN